MIVVIVATIGVMAKINEHLAMVLVMDLLNGLKARCRKMTFEQANNMIDDISCYFHGGKERRETGLTIKEVVEHFKNDLSVIVVDPIKGKYYRAGKLLEVVDTTKNAKSIEFKPFK